MRYLGVDFGLRRIGLAVSNGEIASPFKILEVKNLKDGVVQVVEISKKEGFDQLVVGLPEGKTGKMVNGFINTLRRNGLKVFEADETLSSKAALENQILTGVSRKNRVLNDDVAAAIILQNWLDETKL